MGSTPARCHGGCTGRQCWRYLKVTWASYELNRKNAWEGPGKKAALSKTLWAPVEKTLVWLSDKRLQNRSEMSKCYKDGRGFTVAWSSPRQLNILPCPPTALLLGPAHEYIAFHLKSDWESKALAGRGVCTVLLPQQPAFPVALVWTAYKDYFKFSPYFHLQAQVWARIFLFLCTIWYLHCCYIARNLISSPQVGTWEWLLGLLEVFSLVPGLWAWVSAKALFPACKGSQPH